MKRTEEMSMLLKQMEPMFNKFGELSPKETNELGKLFTRWTQLNNENLAEIKNTADQNSKEMKNIKDTLSEYETTIAMVEAFLIENDMYESFLVFSDEVIQDFMKQKKPHLTLVQ